MKPRVIAIIGPTATGKSSLAISLAKEYHGEIISADSRQVYKGLNLGTGKVTKKEMRGIPHHLLDIANPKKQFSVTEWKKQAEKSIESIVERKKIPIICGGTGFYIDTLLQGIVIPEVPPNKTLRKSLENKTTVELFKILKKTDPRRAKAIDKNNPARLIRAIEIVKALGKVPSLKKISVPYEILWIGIDLPQDKLKRKINTRLQERIHKGMLQEARALAKQGLSLKRMKQLGLEYGFLARYLEKSISKKEMVLDLAKDIAQYAKRQRTWFRANPSICWYSIDKKGAKKTIEKKVKKFLTSR